MNVGSLFTGIGGFDLGLERAGHRIAWQCEADEWRRGVLAAHWPEVACCSDVRDVHGQQPLGGDGCITASQAHSGSAVEYGPVHLLCGGFPCQDLSVAGRRAGLAGERSGLFYEFARVADLVLPAGGWLLVENVPGLLSSQHGRDFAIVLATLADLGFHDLAWRVLDSRHFGVAQRRRRVYILARRARGQRACTVLLEPESRSGDPQTGGEAGQGVADPSLVSTLAGSGKSGGWRVGADEAAGGQLVTARTLTASERWDGETETFIADTLTSGSHPASNMPGRRREDDTNLAIAFHQTQDPISEVNGGTPAIGRTSIGMGVSNGQGVRRLTPVECERLQGFPDGWTAYGPDSRRYAALGDAVTVNVAEWIGRRLMEVAA